MPLTPVSLILVVTQSSSTQGEPLCTTTDGTPPELQTSFDHTMKDVVLSALDTHDEQPTITHTGNTITMTDTAGNTTTVSFISQYSFST